MNRGPAGLVWSGSAGENGRTEGGFEAVTDAPSPSLLWARDGSPNDQGQRKRLVSAMLKRPKRF